MVQQRQENKYAKAVKVIQSAEQKIHQSTKKVVFEAAKKARRMRIDGRLQPLYIIDTEGCGRMLRRG